MSVARLGDELAPSVLWELPLGDEVFVGLFLCSHDADVLEQATFHGVRLIRPVKDGFTPYRDYIGSGLELLTRQSTEIDTGFATRNNNDHVLSFDVRMLGISDQSQDQRQSTIYTLPATGGAPRRITKLTPSYLHGWSPDGSGWSAPAGAAESSTSTGSPRTAAARRSASPTSRGSTTGPSGAPTAATSTSTRRAAGRCRSGA
jgi:hypothetical protein